MRLAMNRGLPAALAVALALVVFPGQRTAAQDAPKDAPLSPAQVDQVRELIREVLTSNPEIVVEAIKEAQRRQELAEQERKRQVIAELRTELEDDAATPSTGSSDADVVIVEFFDYNCPYCRKITDDMMSAVRDDSGVRWVFKDFPILGPASVYAARAALAADRQGKYLDFHLALMRGKGKLTEELVLRRAADVGLDIEQLKADMESEAITATLERNFNLAEELEVRGTPAIVIGDTFIPGAISRQQLQQYIAQTRKQG